MSTEADEQRIVHNLSVMMLGKLRANRHKPNWNPAGCFDQISRMKSLLQLAIKEMDELKLEIETPNASYVSPAKVALECADVAKRALTDRHRTARSRPPSNVRRGKHDDA